MRVERLSVLPRFEITDAQVVERTRDRFSGFAAVIEDAVETASLDVTNHDLFPNAIFARENAADAPNYVREIAVRITDELSLVQGPKKRDLVDGAVTYFSQKAEDLVDRKSSHVSARQVRARMTDIAVLVVARTKVSDGPAPTTRWSTRAVLDTVRGLCQDAMMEERQRRTAYTQLSTV